MPTKYIATKTLDEAERYKARRDALFNATPAQIDAYIDANVTDLASAKQFLKKLTKLLVFTVKSLDR